MCCVLQLQITSNLFCSEERFVNTCIKRTIDLLRITYTHSEIVYKISYCLRHRVKSDMGMNIIPTVSSPSPPRPHCPLPGPKITQNVNTQRGTMKGPKAEARRREAPDCRFQDRDSSSIRCFSFIYCLYLFIIDHPVVFRKV